MTGLEGFSRISWAPSEHAGRGAGPPPRASRGLASLHLYCSASSGQRRALACGRAPISSASLHRSSSTNAWWESSSPSLTPGRKTVAGSGTLGASEMAAVICIFTFWGNHRRKAHRAWNTMWFRPGKPWEGHVASGLTQTRPRPPVRRVGRREEGLSPVSCK